MSQFNAEMGNWVIQKLFESKASAQSASLIGKVIVCDQENSEERLKLLLEHILKQFEAAKAEIKHNQILTREINGIIEFVSIFIRTLRYASRGFTMSG